ncbi:MULTISPECIES: accessory Sec system protein Asp2 [Aerococcus]|uniref:accessory Sec system protein Asp2 n=1 Tax=Aerococcus TaxID=1375 RepID=UPI000DCED327|nr:accessory Sec system protein Asp2 [Aerococcus urinae]MDK7303543.1 accessory Sec system protein Asp2 [Aerococcus urinae]RAV71608.1 accessory Sec system protein Asp2 [Aerococcus urinae]RAW04984.1 accessory Sec system protein Asp2 [Aerococcus urinae]
MTRVLQIGYSDWSQGIAFKNEVDWTFVLNTEFDEFYQRALEEDTLPERPYSLVLLTAPMDALFVDKLLPLMEAYSVLIDRQFESYYTSPDFKLLFSMKKAQFIEVKNIAETVIELAKVFFDANYGERRGIKDIVIQPNFFGNFRYEGNNYIVFNLNHLKEMTPLFYWRRYTISTIDRYLDIWLEYLKDESVDLQLTITYIREGSRNQIVQRLTYGPEQVKKRILLDPPENTYASFSLAVKGNGQLKIGPLHFRHSRKKWGDYLPGGQIISDNNREEFAFYYNPGNLKPPLNVYFSGYRTAEGFEGFPMMKNMDHPFILINDLRSEGGAFYRASAEYEANIVGKIIEVLEELNFTKDQLILSGMSMGTYGALYYSTILDPFAVILSRPIVYLGNVTKNQRLRRPNNLFQTAMDLTLRFGNQEDLEEDLNHLDRMLIPKLRHSQYTQSIFAMVYMSHEDYDDKAYHSLLENLSSKPIKIISKSVMGRHNDNGPRVVSWFRNQYKRILWEKFDSKEE